MLFGIGLPELFVLATLGLLVFGPDRLPDMAARAARGVRNLRDYTSRTLAELNVESAAVTKTLSDLQSLTPRAIVSDVVGSVVGDTPVRTAPNTPAASSGQATHLRAVFDPDAT